MALKAAKEKWEEKKGKGGKQGGKKRNSRLTIPLLFLSHDSGRLFPLALIFRAGKSILGFLYIGVMGKVNGDVSDGWIELDYRRASERGRERERVSERCAVVVMQPDNSIPSLRFSRSPLLIFPFCDDKIPPLRKAV